MQASFLLFSTRFEYNHLTRGPDTLAVTVLGISTLTRFCSSRDVIIPKLRRDFTLTPDKAVSAFSVASMWGASFVATNQKHYDISSEEHPWVTGGEDP
jgi:hypothetical protein